MNAPRQPGVEPRKEAKVYCLHCPSCITVDIRFLLAASIKSTRSIITKTKTVIIDACLKTVNVCIDIFLSPVDSATVQKPLKFVTGGGAGAER